MGVSFTAAIRYEETAVSSDIACFDRESGHTSVTFPTYALAAEWFAANKHTGVVGVGCCYISNSYANRSEESDFHLSQTNAARLFDALGLVEDGGTPWCGSCDVEDMLGRILIARALAFEVGVGSFQTVGANGARVLHGGYRVGTLGESLARLEALLATCEAENRQVGWS